MAITNRKGLKEQLIPSKLLPGELAIATDTGNAWYCYAAGKVMLMATAQDIETLRQEAQALIIDRIQTADEKNTADIKADEKAILQNQDDIASLQAGLAAVRQEIIRMKDEVLAQIDLKTAADFEFSVSVKAADKSLIDVNVDAFKIGYLTEIVIPPLDIDKDLICTEITNHLYAPEKDEYTFGAVQKTSSGYVAQSNEGGSHK